MIFFSSRDTNVMFLSSGGFSKKGLKLFYVKYTAAIKSHKANRNTNTEHQNYSKNEKQSK